LKASGKSWMKANKHLNIDVDLWQSLKMEAAKRSMTLSQLIEQFCAEKLRRMKVKREHYQRDKIQQKEKEKQNTRLQSSSKKKGRLRR
jgi:predicted DNA-binding ribbon-helix-helix protein